MLMNTLWLWGIEFLSNSPPYLISVMEKKKLYLTEFEMGKKVIIGPVCLFLFFKDLKL